MIHIGINILITLISLFICPFASATPHISDFSLGLSREEILLRQVTDHGDHYCGEVGFGGLTWGGAFLFEQDQLTVISLAAPLDDEYLAAGLNAFSDSAFVIYQVVSDVQGFDFAQLTRQGYTPGEVDRAFAAFMSQLTRAGSSFCTFFYAKPAVLKQVGENGAAQDAETAVSCCLTIDQEGLTVIMMSWEKMQQELTQRMDWAQQALTGNQSWHGGSRLLRLPSGHQHDPEVQP